MTRPLATLTPGAGSPAADLKLNMVPHVVDGLGAYLGFARGVGTTMSVDLSDVTLSVGPLRRSIETASTVELTLSDPNDSLIETAIIGSEWTVSIGEQVFGTVQKRRNDWGSWTVVLESELVLALKADKAYRHAARSPRMTRALFARQVAAKGLGRVGGRFFSPELYRVQVEQRTERQRSRSKGLNAKQTLRVKTAKASASQIRVAEQALDAAVRLNATRRPMIALIAAGIIESELTNLTYGDADSQGFLQARVGIHGLAVARSVARSAEKFLNDPGFAGAGGAISLAAKHPDWEPWQIAATVQAPRADLRGRYKTFEGIDIQAQAEAFVDAYGGAPTGEDDTEYTFQQGEPGKPARAWDALEQLASEVNWRRFEVGNTLFFMAEDDLIRSVPRGVIEMRRRQPGLLGAPLIDLDDGKAADEIQVDWSSGLWDSPPGTVVVVQNSGKMDGRWLVTSIERADLLDDTTSVTLSRPDAARPEPQGNTRTKDGPSESETTDGIKLGTAWGGAQSVFEQFIDPFMKRRGLTPGSRKRTARGTATGGISDHWTGSKDSYATDYPTTSGEGIARALADAFGWSNWQPNSYAAKTVRVAGKQFRLQILWGAGVSHTDHVHVGLKRL